MNINGLDGTQNNDLIVQKMLQTQIMTQMFKQTMGDSPVFQIVLDSLLNAMQKSKSSNPLIESLINKPASYNKLDNLEPLKTMNYYNNYRRFNNQNYGHISSNKTLTSKSARIDRAVEKASMKYGLNTNLIMAIMKQESDFDPNCVSSAGAKGLMQLMPETASEVGVTDPFNIEQNIDGSCKYIKRMIDMHGGSIPLGLAAYNAGPGTVKWRGVKTVDDIRKLPSETRYYVKNIMSDYRKNS